MAIDTEKRKARALRYYYKHKDKCKSAAMRWQKENRDKVRAASRKRYRQNPVFYREKAKLFNLIHRSERLARRRQRFLNRTQEMKRKTRGYKREEHLKRYRLTKAEYEKMVAEQNGLCALCGKPQKEGRKKHLSIDHDHKTGAVRALLCDRCNMGIGLFDENPEFLRKAASYLVKHAKRPKSRANAFPLFVE